MSLLIRDCKPELIQPGDQKCFHHVDICGCFKEDTEVIGVTYKVCLAAKLHLDFLFKPQV